MQALLVLAELQLARALGYGHRDSFRPLVADAGFGPRAERHVLNDSLTDQCGLGCRLCQGPGEKFLLTMGRRLPRRGFRRGLGCPRCWARCGPATPSRRPWSGCL